MAEQSVLPGYPSAGAHRHDDPLEIGELRAEGVLGELFLFRHVLAVRTYPAAGEIKCDRIQSRVPKLAREVRKKSPVRESLEAVADDDRPLRIVRAKYFTANGTKRPVDLEPGKEIL